MKLRASLFQLGLRCRPGILSRLQRSLVGGHGRLVLVPHLLELSFGLGDAPMKGNNALRKQRGNCLRKKRRKKKKGKV